MRRCFHTRSWNSCILAKFAVDLYVVEVLRSGICAFCQIAGAANLTGMTLPGHHRHGMGSRGWIARGGSHRGGELGLVCARILQVQLDLLHGVWHIKGPVLALVHRHNVAGHAVVQDIIRLVYHHMEQVEPVCTTDEGLDLSHTLASFRSSPALHA